MLSRWDTYFVDMARLVSTKSKDPSTQTGAVLVHPDRHIVSTGFNGFPQKMEDRSQWYNNREEKYSRIVHCEMNALIFAREPLTECTLYTFPFLSCDRCVVHMIQAGVSRFVAPKPTEDQLSRWGDALEKTKKYIYECGLMVEEI